MGKTSVTSRLLRSLLPGAMGMCLGILFLAFMASGVIYDFEDSVQENLGLPDVDVIVCLAGGRGRIAEAGKVWLRYFNQYENEPHRIPLLYISGMGPKANWNVLNQHLDEDVKAKIQTKHVYFETVSADTFQNAKLVAAFMRKRPGNRLLIMTSSYHMRRAVYLFEQTLPQDREWKILAHAIYSSPFLAGEWRSEFIGIQVTMTEYLKLVFSKAFI